MDNIMSKWPKGTAFVLTIVAAIGFSSIAALIFVGASNNNTIMPGTIPNAFSQEYTPIISDKTATIKVTGYASEAVKPDQAVMILALQTQPGNISSVLDEQQEKTDQITNAIMSAVGENENNRTATTIILGQQYLNNPPSYGGPVPASYINATFSIYASIPVQTDINHLPSLIGNISAAGFGFETVSWQGSAAFVRDLKYGPAGLPDDNITNAGQKGEGGENEQDISNNAITLYIQINTKQDVLSKALDEYGQKYTKLAQVLNKIGISVEQIQPADVHINPNFFGQGQNYSGYSSNLQIIVRTDPRDVQKITNAAQKFGARVDSTYLSLSDSAVDKAREELNRQAFDDAKARAKELAGSLGLGVKSIAHIETGEQAFNSRFDSYRGVNVIPPYYYQNINGELSTSITVEFELGERQQQ